MTALDEQRALMEQLMGLERDVPVAQRTGKTRMFYDPNVCKYHVAGLSPFTLFKVCRPRAKTHAYKQPWLKNVYIRGGPGSG